MTMRCASPNFWPSTPRWGACTIRFVEGHPQRALAMEQMHGGGGVLSFEVDGTGEDARHLSEALRLFTLAPSLGGVDSLVSLPVLTSHAMISAEQRQKMGVTDQLIRLSVGIENADDLIADLEQALTVVAGTRQHARGHPERSGRSRSEQPRSRRTPIVSGVAGYGALRTTLKFLKNPRGVTCCARPSTA